MPHSHLLQSLLDGSLSRDLRLLAARGIAPLPAAEMLRALFHLARDKDADIAEAARNSLSGLSEDEIISAIQAPESDPDILEELAQRSPSPAVMEALLLSPSTSPSAVELLCPNLPDHLLETALLNRVRILQQPSILEALKRNPFLTQAARRTIAEIEAGFFLRGQSGSPADNAAEAMPGAASLPPEPESFEGDLSLEGLPADPDAREAALFERIACMTVPQKVRAALLGPREARAILVRDSNKEVARSVLRSPKIGESEVETIAALRSVAEDVLREIGSNREWTRNYVVVQNLVRNPKTPVMIAQKLIPRLHAKDLSLLSRDRGVPEAVRSCAQRALAQRFPQRSAR